MEDFYRDFDKKMHVDGGSIPYDWKTAVSKPLEDGDLTGIKESSVTSLQLQMLQLAHTAKSETVRYNATAFLLAQGGHGPMNRVEHTVDYKRLPAEQLQAVIQGKLESLVKLNPNLDVKALLPKIEDGSEDIPKSDVSRETVDIVEADFEEDND